MSTKPKRLIDLVATAEQGLLSLYAQYHPVRAFMRELARASRKKTFHIRNQIAWAAMLHSRDALFIHTASWAKTMYAPGGFFGVLQAHHLPSLYVRKPRARRRDIEPFEDEHFVDVRRREAFARRFPKAAARSTGRVDAAEVTVLKDRFEKRFRKIVNDRDEHRAHPYEAKTASTTMLDPALVGSALRYCEALLNDLRMIADGGSTHYPDHVPGEDENATANVFVDLVLFGTPTPAHGMFNVPEILRERTGVWPYAMRKAFYEAVHRAHRRVVKRRASGEDDPEPRFNDPGLIYDEVVNRKKTNLRRKSRR